MYIKLGYTSGSKTDHELLGKEIERSTNDVVEGLVGRGDQLDLSNKS